MPSKPQKGLIRVVCRYDSEDKQTVIEVIDNGVGIPPSMMGHMFELFHSTKGNRGTGLGPGGREKNHRRARRLDQRQKQARRRHDIHASACRSYSREP